MAPLCVIGRSELVTQPIRDNARQDLGFAIDFKMIDSIEGLQRVTTRPDSFDLAYGRSAMDRALCPADPVAAADPWGRVLQAVRGWSGPSRNLDTVFAKLIGQPDGRLARDPS